MGRPEDTEFFVRPINYSGSKEKTCYSGRFLISILLISTLLFLNIAVIWSQKNLVVNSEDSYDKLVHFLTHDENGEEEGIQQHLKHSKLKAAKRDYLTTPEMIKAAGYPSESHTVTTEDGYILTMHRIPHGKVNGSGTNEAKRVIFLQHGLFGTSADWILNSVEKSLGGVKITELKSYFTNLSLDAHRETFKNVAYMLADSGYDVWLGNARGNEYSTNHTTLSPELFSFWRFSWHEMGYYDLPAELNYVMNATGQSSIYYNGHSMGTTMFFVLTSTRPEFNKKIRVMTALGPAVYLSNTKSAVKYFATYWGRAEKILLDVVGRGVLFPRFLVKLIHWFAPEACTPELKVQKLCEWVIALIAGFDTAQANYTLLPNILQHEPSTESSQTCFHYFQVIKSGKFAMYDKGFHDSMPEYDLSKVTVPVGLFWGDNDILVDPKDVHRLSKTLPNVALNFRVNFTQFNHIDFIFAKDVDTLLNKPLIKFLEKY